MARKVKSKTKTKELVKVDKQGQVKGRFIPNTIERSVDTLVGVHRPAVVAHLNAIKRKHPDASVEQLHWVLERRYLATVTSTGAATGATAVIPAVGTATALALSAAETVAFLETTALFAQSVAELHGISVDEPERTRTLVLALMLGHEGSDIVKQFGLEMLNEDVTRAGYWGAIVSDSVPTAVLKPVLNKLKTMFFKKVAAKQAGSIIGRALPYGIGAVVGGVGNNLLGRRVVNAARNAFPPADVIVLDDEIAKRALAAHG
ncbi:hypothetical protein [Gryllotalpicola protaetiae]|uniref:EcsC family protein n=1 Tax=Gryllotalpicola protaetiae TaxID=2419771 RepID=A0A387BJQ3_9MICO|nr:hypothetical protein [Gryllotalpicola protaetiae]AYG02482.1 hypothetical protein D7I44_02365 [Gryllotalpicola protaetiae]